METRSDGIHSKEAALAATIVVTPQKEATSSQAPGAPPVAVAVVEGSGPQLATETQSLLRSRLRAAALFLLLTTVLFFARNVVGLVVEREFFRSFDLVIAFHAVLIVALGAGLSVLSGRRPLTLRHLRALEVAIFALMTAFLATRQYQAMLRCILRDDAPLLLVAIKTSLIYTFALLVTYGMFIPNSWRRAALVAAPMAITPIVVQLLLQLQHPELSRIAGRVATFAQVSENFLFLLVGVVLATYGTHTINTLRREAFEARQLGQYQLREKLGAGGMGEVYLAEHRLLKRPCALKLIRPGRAADATALARFEREVRSTARLSHWNTIEIYDYGRTEDGTFYYVMEYLRGLSLADLVARHGPLPPGRVVYLLRQACDALAEAHAAGLIHRDLKPANIFAARRGGRDDVTKLLDFGLVKPTAEPQAADLSQDGTVTGSPHFMSPEQATGDRPLDARSDLYSLGAVAYFLLTGRPPFAGPSAMGVMIAHARDPVVPPAQLRPDVPEDLERIVLRCLAKDPADRFPDAEGLERALASCRCAGEWDARRAAQWWYEVERAEKAAAAVTATAAR